MAFFALVSVVNEVKRVQVMKPTIAPVVRIADFQKGFFTNPCSYQEAKSSVPTFEDAYDLVKSSLGNLDSNQKNYQFAFLYSDQKDKTTPAFQKYAHSLQKDGEHAL